MKAHRSAGFSVVGNIVGVVVVALFIFLLVDYSELCAKFGEGPVTAAGLVYLAAVFAASYLFEAKSFLFSAIMGVCNYLSWPSGRWMAFVYSAIFIVAAITKLVLSR